MNPGAQRCTKVQWELERVLIVYIFDKEEGEELRWTDWTRYLDLVSFFFFFFFFSSSSSSSSSSFSSHCCLANNFSVG